MAQYIREFYEEYKAASQECSNRSQTVIMIVLLQGQILLSMYINVLVIYIHLIIHYNITTDYTQFRRKLAYTYYNGLGNNNIISRHATI